MANYWLFWSCYLAAAGVFIAIVWRLFVFRRYPLLSILARSTSIAVLLTPWTSNPSDPYLAPALMVMTLDAITLGGSAAVRAFVPLLLALVLSLGVGVALWMKGRRSNKRKATALN